MNLKYTHVAVCLLGIALTGILPIHAEVISIQLGRISDNDMTSTTVAGVVPEDNWNEVGGTPTFGNVALNLDDGTSSGATISVDDLNSNRFSHVGVTADPNTLMFNTLAAIQTTASTSGGSTFTVNTLPTTGAWASGYDVYVYFSVTTQVVDTDTHPLDLTLGGTTYYAELVNGSSNYTGTFDLVDSTNSAARQSGNYVKFSGITGSSFDLTLAGGATSSQRLGAAGIQIVAIPEPSTLLMMLSAFAGFLFFRRRRS